MVSLTLPLQVDQSPPLLVRGLHNKSWPHANVIRSIKREIGHLCHDENRPSKNGTAQAQITMPPPPATETSALCMSLLYSSLSLCRHRRSIYMV
jgi:hypothetical protein